MINDVLKDARIRMGKTVENVKMELSKLRTGRAHTSLLDHIKVDYYGSEVPLSQAANIGLADARTITVTPWEQKMVAAIEKAIMNSDLGLTPNTAGNMIRINVPVLTEERRKELSKVVHQEGENGKIAIRNIRRDANQHCKELLKEKEITEDEERHAETEVQTLTDKYCTEIDELIVHKDEELMEI